LKRPLDGAYEPVEEMVRASIIENALTHHEDFEEIVRTGSGLTKYDNRGALVNFCVQTGCKQVTKIRS